MGAADTAVQKKAHLIAPHGGELIDRTVSGDEAAAPGRGGCRAAPACACPTSRRPTST